MSPQIHRHYKRALELARQADDRPLLAESLYNFGFAPEPDAGKLGGARRELVDRSWTRRWRSTGSWGMCGGQAAVLWGISTPLITEKRFAEAIESLEAGLALYRQIDDKFGIGWSQYMLGQVALTQDRSTMPSGTLVTRCACSCQRPTGLRRSCCSRYSPLLRGRRRPRPGLDADRGGRLVSALDRAPTSCCRTFPDSIGTFRSSRPPTMPRRSKRGSSVRGCHSTKRSLMR